MEEMEEEMEEEMGEMGEADWGGLGREVGRRGRGGGGGGGGGRKVVWGVEGEVAAEAMMQPRQNLEGHLVEAVGEGRQEDALGPAIGEAAPRHSPQLQRVLFARAGEQLICGD